MASHLETRPGFLRTLVPASCKVWPVFFASSERLSDVMTHLPSQDQPDWHSRAAWNRQVGRMEPDVGLG